jgi:hypothetical protein
LLSPKCESVLWRRKSLQTSGAILNLPFQVHVNDISPGNGRSSLSNLRKDEYIPFSFSCVSVYSTCVCGTTIVLNGHFQALPESHSSNWCKPRC